jgi:hypothetical protein
MILSCALQCRKSKKNQKRTFRVNKVTSCEDGGYIRQILRTSVPGFRLVIIYSVRLKAEGLTGLRLKKD